MKKVVNPMLIANCIPKNEALRYLIRYGSVVNINNGPRAPQKIQTLAGHTVGAISHRFRQSRSIHRPKRPTAMQSKAPAIISYPNAQQKKAGNRGINPHNKPLRINKLIIGKFQRRVVSKFFIRCSAAG